MEKKTDTRYSWTGLLTQGLTIPAWLLAATTIALIVASSLKVTIPSVVVVLIPIVLMVIGFLSSKGKPTPKAQRQISDPEFPDNPNYRITVSDFQDSINPTLLSKVDREALKGLGKADGISAVTSVVGDLVFEVNDFDAPVSLTIPYTDADEQAQQVHQDELRARLMQQGEQGRQAALQLFVELIPVYLETKFQEGKPVQIWKPLPDYVIDTANRTITVKVSHWGDTNIGVGTKP